LVHARGFVGTEAFNALSLDSTPPPSARGKAPPGAPPRSGSASSAPTTATRSGRPSIACQRALPELQDGAHLALDARPTSRPREHRVPGASGGARRPRRPGHGQHRCERGLKARRTSRHKRWREPVAVPPDRDKRSRARPEASSALAPRLAIKEGPRAGRGRPACVPREALSSWCPVSLRSPRRRRARRCVT